MLLYRKQNADWLSIKIHAQGNSGSVCRQGLMPHKISTRVRITIIKFYPAHASGLCDQYWCKSVYVCVCVCMCVGGGL